VTLGRQAKTLTPAQYRVLLLHVGQRPTSSRDAAIVTLSFKQGLRSVEIGALTWGMLLDAEGQVAHIALPSVASKGKYGGRVLPLHPDTRNALDTLIRSRATPPSANEHVVQFSKGATARNTRAATIQYLFRTWFNDLGFAGCSSHSGRRSFVTSCARNVSRVGGSVRDVMALSGHASLASVQRYIEADPEAARKLVELA
jgi:integrase